jgi:HEAT repeat protein
MTDKTSEEREYALYTKRVPNDTHSPEELIEEALRVGDPDDHAYWEPVTVLWHRGSADVLEAARKLCRSGDPKERELGANILGQLGSKSDALHEERLQALLSLLDGETEPQVLAATCIALGHLYDVKAHKSLVRFKDHPDEDVRYGVVVGLTGDLGEKARAALIELSGDVDSDVRDWATFRLGMNENATPDVLDALAARLLDEDDDTRAEAIVGLARNKDQRAIEPLIEDLDTLKAGDEDWAYRKGLLYEAARELGDPRLCPVLLKNKSVVTDEDLDEALEKCGCEIR